MEDIPDSKDDVHKLFWVQQWIVLQDTYKVMFGIDFYLHNWKG